MNMYNYVHCIHYLSQIQTHNESSFCLFGVFFSKETWQCDADQFLFQKGEPLAARRLKFGQRWWESWGIGSTPVPDSSHQQGHYISSRELGNPYKPVFATVTG